ncbi:MAG: carboxypeptidase regulatory-like domain-containing protein, partial [Planctomycetes bacterium]|nr:carboxypeptidase regulatory-like domain-containing protein [Planctomycetota bacterium]
MQVFVSMPTDRGLYRALMGGQTDNSTLRRWIQLAMSVGPWQSLLTSLHHRQDVGFAVAALCAATLVGFVSSASAASTLTVKAFKDGTWLGGNATWISRARVRLIPQNSGATRTAFTNGNGVATFHNVDNGRYNIQVIRSGYQTASRGYLKASYNQNVNMALTPLVQRRYRLEIRPFRYRTFNSSTREAQWLSGASVQVTKSGTGEIMGRRLTGSTGRALYVLPSGIYRVTINKRGYKQ